MGFRWTVGRKLAAGYAVALVMLVAVGAVAYRSLSGMVESAGWVAHTHQVLQGLEGVLSLLKDAETGQRGFLLTRNDKYLEPHDAAVGGLANRLRDLRAQTRDNDRQQRRLDELDQLVAGKVAELRETIDLRRADPPPAGVEEQRPKGLLAALAVVQSDRGRKQMDDIRRVVGDMERDEADLLARRRQEEQESVRVTNAVIVGGSLAAGVAVAAIGVWITRGITRQLTQVGAAAGQVAGGDLRQEATVSSADEIGQLAGAFNGMVGGLRAMAAQIGGATAGLTAAAAQIGAAIREQAASTRQQAATVQQITATMDEISQTGAQVTGKAKQVAAATEATSAASAAGTAAVQDTVRTMGSIRDQVEEVAENIVALSEKTQAVGEIIATVNDLAERSNLLALNAAIEAASAGEFGSRFSVVAGEMKNLADQAKESTVQVRGILGDIQKGINSSVMLTEEAVKRVEAGKQQADLAEGTIRQMARSALESVQAFEQIIGANNQQQIGFEQVAQGMKDIRQAATQTAAANAQLERAVADLNGQSQGLKEAVARYKL